MAHQLTVRKNGKVEFAARKGTQAWHGLGNELPETASIEDFIAEAGMDWRILRSKVRYETDRTPGAAPRVWDQNHVLFRSDNGDPLGIVSPKFKIVQPRQVVEFFRDLCADNSFTMRTCGTLFGGRRMWALADIGAESYVLRPEDKVKGRLLLVTATDGTMATMAKFVSECVVCNNTLSIATAEDGREVRTSHRSVFDAADVKAKLGLAGGQFSKFIRQARDMAQRELTKQDALVMTESLFGARAADKSQEEIRETRGFKLVMALFNGAAMGANIEGRTGTAWAWLNAVTEYADHHVAARSDENRFNSAQFGTGDTLKSRALEMAVEAAGSV